MYSCSQKNQHTHSFKPISLTSADWFCALSARLLCNQTGQKITNWKYLALIHLRVCRSLYSARCGPRIYAVNAWRTIWTELRNNLHLQIVQRPVLFSLCLNITTHMTFPFQFYQQINQTPTEGYRAGLTFLHFAGRESRWNVCELMTWQGCRGSLLILRIFIPHVHLWTCMWTENYKQVFP